MANVEVQMDALNRRLQKMRANITNPSTAMQKTATFMQKDVLDHFNKGKDETTSWTPLKYRKGKPLLDTGRLRNSIKSSNTKDAARVGTNVKYAATHNYGRGAIPQRKFLWISKPALGEITKILGKFFIAE
jgi:phage gpG-like protein